MSKIFKTTVGAAILTGAVYTAVKNKETIKEKLPKTDEKLSETKTQELQTEVATDRKTLKDNGKSLLSKVKSRFKKDRL